MKVLTFLPLLLVIISGFKQTSGKKFKFEKSKYVPGFAFFTDTNIPHWERGHVVGYGFETDKGELYFKSYLRQDAIAFYLPSKTDLFLDYTPKWSAISVGDHVLVKLNRQLDEWHDGKVVSRRLDTKRVTVKALMSKDKQEFSYRDIRIQGYDACRHVENDCDPALEHCVSEYLRKGVLSPGHYSCGCVTGYQRNHDNKCIDVDECETFPCEKGFSCENRPGNYSCECPVGFKGKNCDEDINECQNAPCLKNMRCENLQGSFDCKCRDGFTGKNCDVRVTRPTRKSNRVKTTTGATAAAPSLLRKMNSTRRKPKVDPVFFWIGGGVLASVVLIIVGCVLLRKRGRRQATKDRKKRRK